MRFLDDQTPSTFVDEPMIDPTGVILNQHTLHPMTNGLTQGSSDLNHNHNVCGNPQAYNDTLASDQNDKLSQPLYVSTYQANLETVSNEDVN